MSTMETLDELKKWAKSIDNKKKLADAIGFKSECAINNWISRNNIPWYHEAKVKKFIRSKKK
jgi:hypothetical protein